MKKIFYNGNILTLEDELYVDSIMIEDDKITYLGSFDNIKNENAEFIDLQGKTLMPSFIDPHSHIGAFSSTLLICNLTGCKNFDEIVDRLIKYKNENGILDDENKYIVGFGYDHNDLSEGMHPDKEVLDRVSKSNPVLISHKSGHMGVVNSKLIEKENLNEKIGSFKEGSYGLDSNGNLNGYLEETSFIGLLGGASNNFTIDELVNAYEKAEDIYLSYGITTAQDGLTKKPDFQLLKLASDSNKMKLDVISYIDIKDNASLLEENKDYLKYKNHLRIGGYKLILDGSPQGKTAWMSKPYEGEESYSGYPIYKDEEVESFVRKAQVDNVQSLTHCNGDASSEQLIRSYEKLEDKSNLVRPVMIHAQTVRHDQIKRMKALKMMPSFFIAHTYHWGDIHLKNLGERALNISPVKWAIEEGLTYTFHQDTPVILPDMLETIWCAVNRKTKSGKVLGNQQITVLEAIKGVTINAAYQYFEEDSKGSLKVGKKADLVILDKDPLKVDVNDIRNIKVLETIKDGNTLYVNKNV